MKYVLCIATIIVALAITPSKAVTTIEAEASGEKSPEPSVCMEEHISLQNELTYWQYAYDKLKEEEKEEYHWETYTITAYTANDPSQGTNNIVATGFNLNRHNVDNLPIAASNHVDLYSIVEIEDMGAYIILDTGLGYYTPDGWEDHKWIDLLFDCKEEAFKFGVQELRVRIIQ